MKSIYTDKEPTTYLQRDRHNPLAFFKETETNTTTKIKKIEII